jgi:hypothetical protein
MCTVLFLLMGIECDVPQLHEGGARRRHHVSRPKLYNDQRVAFHGDLAVVLGVAQGARSCGLGK